MKAVTFQGKERVQVETVPDPRILNPSDIVIEVTSTAICGSDLHLYGAKIPTMLRGDILGHEFMGDVVDVGPAVKSLHVGDRVVVPFNISCGHCAYCADKDFSLCDNSNPNAWLNERLNGQAGAGLFGYTHFYGGYAGGQAEYVRVPFADVGPLKVPKGIPDERVLFLSDIFPTGYMAAENCDIKPGDTVAVWGLGPVGQFAVQSAWLLGAGRVIGIDRIGDRLELARTCGQAEVIDYSKDDVYDTLMHMTGGRGPDACIEAVGMEAHGLSFDALYDTVMQPLHLVNDRSHALRQAIHACRKGGVVSIPGVYSGFIDKVNFGMAFAKGLTMKMGQTHTQRYMRPLLDRIERGEIDPSFVISHRVSLDDAPEAYKIFQKKQDHCTKVVMKPGMASSLGVVH